MNYETGPLYFLFICGRGRACLVLLDLNLIFSCKLLMNDKTGCSIVLVRGWQGSFLFALALLESISRYLFVLSFHCGFSKLLMGLILHLIQCCYFVVLIVFSSFFCDFPTFDSFYLSPFLCILLRQKI